MVLRLSGNKPWLMLWESLCLDCHDEQPIAGAPPALKATHAINLLHSRGEGMTGDLQLWANIAQIVSLLLAVLALALQVVTWLYPTRPAFTPLVRLMRRVLPFVFTAAAFFWLGTRTLAGSVQPEQELQATNTALRATITTLEADRASTGSSSAPVETTMASDTGGSDAQTDASATGTSVSRPAQTPDPAVLFFDDFSQNLEANWQPDAGEWRLVNGQLKIVQFENNKAKIFSGNQNWTDYTVTFDVGNLQYNAFVGGNLVAVYVRDHGGDNNAWFSIGSRSVACGLKKGGNDTEMFSGDLPDSGSRRARVTVVGTQYSLDLDGKNVCSFEDNALSAGRIGLYASINGDTSPWNTSPWVDNFKVTQIR